MGSMWLAWIRPLDLEVSFLQMTPGNQQLERRVGEASTGKPIALQSEAEFRKWFEQNLLAFGVRKIILSQEPCPDYVLQMQDGRIVRVEAELFAVNFRYHRHDPRKVDFILAAYSHADFVEGVPVKALHRLHVWDVEPGAPIPESVPLSRDERTLLRTLRDTGGLAVTALGEGRFAGDHTLWLRFPPHRVAEFPRGIDESILTVLLPDAKRFIKKHHHALIATGLSKSACAAIDCLLRRGLAKYRPIAFICALMDGGIVDHPGWIPMELCPTEEYPADSPSTRERLTATGSDRSRARESQPSVTPRVKSTGKV